MADKKRTFKKGRPELLWKEGTEITYQRLNKMITDAYKSHGTGAHDSADSPKKFQLLGDLVIGGSADAGFVFDDDSGSHVVKDVGGVDFRFKAYDAIGTFSGSAGKRGYVIYNRQAGKWEIIQLGC